MKMNKRKGFTLVELIVVIVILGILMMIGAMKYQDVKRGANLTALRSNHDTIRAALELASANNAGSIPEVVTDKDGNEVKITDFDSLVKAGLISKIVQGQPIGASYVYKDGVITTEVKDQKTVEANYPKKGAKPIKIEENVIDGTISYSPDEAYVLQKKAAKTTP